MDLGLEGWEGPSHRQKYKFHFSSTYYVEEPHSFAPVDLATERRAIILSYRAEPQTQHCDLPKAVCACFRGFEDSGILLSIPWLLSQNHKLPELQFSTNKNRAMCVPVFWVPLGHRTT
jgi:hypothetical protein